MLLSYGELFYRYLKGTVIKCRTCRDLTSTYVVEVRGYFCIVTSSAHTS
jgi:hypothetical protein